MILNQVKQVIMYHNNYVLNVYQVIYYLIINKNVQKHHHYKI